MNEALETIERFNDAFNNHDVEAVMKLMTEDVVFENTSRGRFEGQERVAGVLTRAFELMAKGWFDSENIFVAGDRCVVQWNYAFDRDQPSVGQVRGVDIFRLRGGLVAEKLSYVKSEDFVRQLGLQVPKS